MEMQPFSGGLRAHNLPAMYASARAAARPPTGAGPRPFRLLEIPDGDPGTFATLEVMRGAIAHDLAVARPLIARAARRIIPPGGDPLEAARAIRRYLARSVRFTFDPFDLELVKAPAFQLEEIRTAGHVRGDCDDIATLGAALGIVAGLPARFVVLAFTPSGPFEHVYTELETPGGWVDLDTSRELQRVPPDFQPARRATIEV